MPGSVSSNTLAPFQPGDCPQTQDSPLDGAEITQPSSPGERGEASVSPQQRSESLSVPSGMVGALSVPSGVCWSPQCPLRKGMEPLVSPQERDGALGVPSGRG